MITMSLAKSRLIDVNVTLSAVGIVTSRHANYFQVVGVSDSGAVVVNTTHEDLAEALKVYTQWKGDPVAF